MATTKRLTASANAAKAAWYGTTENMKSAATLRGNLGRVLKTKQDDVTYITISGEKKSDVTKALKELCGSDIKIEYCNPLVCRKRKGQIVEIDGVTRIWVGTVSGTTKVAKAEKAKPVKAKAVKAKAAKATKAKAEVSKEDAMAQIAAMQEQLAKLMEVL